MKKSLTCVLIISLILSIIPFTVLANSEPTTSCISAKEIKNNINEIASVNNDNKTSFTTSEVINTLNSTDGIDSASCQEKEVSINSAVNAIFDSKYQVENAKKITTSKAPDTSYIIEVYDNGSKKVIQTYSDDGSHMSIMELDKDTIDINTYTYKNKNGKFINRDIKFTYTDSETRGAFISQAIKYGKKKTSATWKKKKFWYSNGSNGKKTYLKIGQKASYRIRTDNLSNKKDKKCESYKSAVKKSSSYWLKGSAEIAGTNFSIGVIVGLIVANTAFPPSVIVDVVLAAIGGGSISLAVSGVKNLVNSYEKWEDAEDNYVIIRNYGTKL